MDDCHTGTMYLSTPLCLEGWGDKHADGLTYQLCCPSISGLSSQAPATLGNHLQQAV